MAKDGTDKKKYEAPVIVPLGELSMSRGAQCSTGSVAVAGSCGMGVEAAPACNTGTVADAACVGGGIPGPSCVNGPRAGKPCVGGGEAK